ncbi:hypothetical protein MOB30_04940 [Bacillus spizizenii]|nr:hypothetical protein [Bacillus spizizenii]MCY7995204.1 hypothetical protein [Bacillus spizizenii]
MLTKKKAASFRKTPSNINATAAIRKIIPNNLICSTPFKGIIPAQTVFKPIKKGAWGSA